MELRALGRALLAALAALAVLAGAAAAAGPSGPTGPVGTAGPTGPLATTTAADPNTPVPVTDLAAAQPGRRLTGAQVQAIVDRLPQIVALKRRHRDAYPGVYTKGLGRWQVSYFSRDKPPRELSQSIVDDATGAVTESYTGYKVAWTMARGYPGAFGRKVNSPWVWIPLTVLFLLPFWQWRRPFRWLHLDLLVLCAFGISVAYFNDAQVDTSVPLVYPLVAYLLIRMLCVGLRSRPERDPVARGERLPLLVGPSWLAVGLIFLVGFRIGLNVTDSNVIDVGYAGVIGADHLIHGQPLYDSFPKDNEHGDTYGPVNYAAYVPFVGLLGWSGRWDDLPAAHGAAIFFDLLCLLLLFLLGRRVRGPGLGIALAYGWAAFPFTLYAMSCNSNDSLVAALLLGTLYVAGSPAKRGVLAAAGGLSKFATLGLAPLFATHAARERGAVRTLAVFGLAFGVATLVCLAPVLLQGESLQTMYERTIQYQADRESPFSVWGLYDLPGLQSLWQAFALLLAVGLALVPRRADVVGLGACAAAIVIALQAGVSHWFYLYIVWFFPVVLFALLARYADPVDRGREPLPPPAPVGDERPVLVSA